MGELNCLRCQYMHEDNGNCTAAGGFCTAVPAAHCRLLQEYLGMGLTPEDCAEYKKFEDEIIASGKTFGRLIELLKADKDGRVVVLPCKVGGMAIYQNFAENPTLMKKTRLEIAYESRCGVIFRMGYGIFADLVKHGRIKPVSEEAEEARRAENG